MKRDSSSNTIIIVRSEVTHSKKKLSGFQGNRVSYNAYAPVPIVLEMIRKGRSVGTGAACDYMRLAEPQKGVRGFTSGG